MKILEYKSKNLNEPKHKQHEKKNSKVHHKHIAQSLREKEH